MATKWSEGTTYVPTDDVKQSDPLNEWDSTKTYASEVNLEVALDRLFLGSFKHLNVRTPEGRWTAIFPKSFLGADFMVPVWKGFKVLG